METTYLYLMMNLFIVLGPLLFSFGKKVAFYQVLPKAVVAAAVVAVPFLIWEELFTKVGFWGVNPNYITGFHLSNVPLEEVLFFFTLPVAGTFIYSSLNNWFPNNPLADKEKRITSGLFIFLIPLIFIHRASWYTVTTFSLLVFLLGYLRWYTETPYLHFVYRAYLVFVIPFGLVSAVLTGSITADAVVWYKQEVFTGIRIGTVPFEDFLYGFLLVLANIVVVERLSDRKPGLIR